MRFPALQTILLLFISSFTFGQVVIKGRADLSHDQLQSPTYLFGEWEFYWDKLLSPEDFKSPQNPEYLAVPSSWSRNGYPTLGYGTYRVVITLAESQRGLSLYFPIFNSSGKIWLNGEIVSEVGQVSANRDDYEPQLRGTMVSLPDNRKEHELIIQVANFTYFSAGLPRSPQIDTTEAHLARISRSNGIENFFAGSLIAMFIYQVILYFLYQRGKPYLWLSLICLGVSLRAMIVHGGSFLLPNLYPAVDWEFWKKIEFGSVYGIVAIFPLYVRDLFKDFAPRWPIFGFVAVATFLGAAVLFTPQYVYGQLLEVSHIGLLCGFVYAVYSITRAWRAGNTDARIILLGVLASFPFILMEILKNSLLLQLYIPFTYLVEIGVLVFLLFQVYLLSNHYATSYRNLETLNRNLERIVEERTGELVTANKVKDRLLSVMSHDVKSPLNSLRGLLQFYNSGAISKEEFDRFSRHIEDDLGKTTILVENILYWTASQLKGVQVRNESFGVNAVVGEITNLFQTIAAHKKIILKVLALPEDVRIVSDKNIVYLVLRNLVSNAIKFSNYGSEVFIAAAMTDDGLEVVVADNGIGMDPEVINSLEESENSVSTLGTNNEKGTGLGLTLCREYLEKIGGKLKIESEKGKGSRITVQIPLKAEAVSIAK